MWNKEEITKVVRKTEKLRNERGQSELDAVCTVVASWGIPFKIFMPVYKEVYGTCPQELEKYLDPDCPFCG